MYRYAERKNLAGIVLDAPIRDALQISGGSVPLYATGSTPAAPTRRARAR